MSIEKINISNNTRNGHDVKYGKKGTDVGKMTSIQSVTRTVIGGVDLSLYTMDSNEIEVARKAVIAFNKRTGEYFFEEGIMGKALRENNGNIKSAISDINDFNDRFTKLKRTYPDNPKYTETRATLISGLRSLVNKFDLTVAETTDVVNLAKSIVNRQRKKLNDMRNDLRSKREMGIELSFSETCVYNEERGKLMSADYVLSLAKEGVLRGEYNCSDLLHEINVRLGHDHNMRTLIEENAD